MIRQEDVYRIGRIGKTHGVDGELTFMFDDDVFFRDDVEYLVLDIDGILVPFFMDECRMKSSSTALVKFAGIRSQERARELTGCEVFFPRSMSRSAGEPLSSAETVGYRVADEPSGEVIGTVCAVDESTMNPLFELQRSDGTMLLLPAAADLITRIDSEARVITMRLPDGILDLNKEKE